MSGILALVGGGEFSARSSFETTLFPPGCTVHVVPTAEAYENPTATLEVARRRLEELGATATVVEAYTRTQAFDPGLTAEVAAATHIYVLGGSPMHLRSVIKDSPVWDALVAAWQDGAVVAAASGAARVLCDPMVDPRGGAFTVGLGLLPDLAVIPHHNDWSEDKAHRTLLLAPASLLVVGIDDATALIRDPDGTWRVEGTGGVAVFRARDEVGLEALPTD